MICLNMKKYIFLLEIEYIFSFDDLRKYEEKNIYLLELEYSSSFDDFLKYEKVDIIT